MYRYFQYLVCQWKGHCRCARRTYSNTYALCLSNWLVYGRVNIDRRWSWWQDNPTVPNYLAIIMLQDLFHFYVNWWMRDLQAVTGPAKASERRMNFWTITVRKVTTVAFLYVWKEKSTLFWPFCLVIIFKWTSFPSNILSYFRIIKEQIRCCFL